MNTKNIYIYVFYIVLYSMYYYISNIIWVIELSVYIIIYFLIFYLLYITWKKIRNSIPMLFTDFIYYFLYKLSIFIIVLLSLLWSFSYYYNEISPAPMPEYTISNWTKTIVFQAMSHIWTKEFYQNIKNNIKENKTNWFVYFFEWVKPGSEESTKKFNQALKVNFNDKLYKNFSKLYWISNQDNRDFFGLVNSLDFNVDLNMDEIVALYEKKTTNKKIKKEIIPLDITEDITNTLLSLNERQLKILVYINKSILNFIVGSPKLQKTLTDNVTDKDLFDVILNERNKNLSNEIINSKYNNIYITYWLLHFKWVLELLQDNDSNWKIIKQINYYPIK